MPSKEDLLKELGALSASDDNAPKEDIAPSEEKEALLRELGGLEQPTQLKPSGNDERIKLLSELGAVPEREDKSFDLKKFASQALLKAGTSMGSLSAPFEQDPNTVQNLTQLPDRITDVYMKWAEGFNPLLRKGRQKFLSKEENQAIQNRLDDVAPITETIGQMSRFAILAGLIPASEKIAQIPRFGIWASRFLNTAEVITASNMVDELAKNSPSFRGFAKEMKNDAPFLAAAGLTPFAGLKYGMTDITLAGHLVGRGAKFTVGGAAAYGTSRLAGHSHEESVLDAIRIGGLLSITGGATRVGGKLPTIKTPYRRLRPGTAGQPQHEPTQKTKLAKKFLEEQRKNAIRDTGSAEKIGKKLAVRVKEANQVIDKTLTVRDAVERTFSVTEPFNRIGAPATGQALKNIYGVQEKWTEKYVKEVVDPITDMNLTEDELMQVYFSAGKPKLNIKDKALKAKITPAVEITRKYLDEFYGELKDAEVLNFSWDEGVKTRLQTEILDLKEAMVKSNTKERMSVLQSQLSTKQDMMEMINKTDLRFTPIPVKLWFQDMMSDDLNYILPKIYNKSFKQRTTLDPEDLARELLKQNIITKAELDPRRVLADYTQRAAQKLSVGRLEQALKKDGLALKEEAASQGEASKLWPKANSTAFPGLKGYRIHPEVDRFMERELIQYGFDRAQVGRVLGWVKGWQFVNPSRLAFNDIHQGFWLGTFRDIGGMKKFIDQTMKEGLTKASKDTTLYRGVKSVQNKDKDYLDATEHGAMSKLYGNSWESFMGDVDRAIEGNSDIKNLMKAAKSLNPVATIDELYHIVHKMAWEGDHMIRMMSYHFLKDQGFSIEEAAELTSRYHGAYDDVPNSTRQLMNKLFFVPTFKVAMTKLQLDMASSTAKTFRKSKRNRRTDLAAMALLAEAAILIARGLMFKKLWGFKEEDIGYKYTKQIQTENGTEELVVTTPTPFQIYRQLAKFKQFGRTNDPLRKLESVIPFTMHPLWSSIYKGFLQNRRDDGEPVRNENDDWPLQVMDFTRYMTARLVRMTALIPGMQDKLKRKKAMKEYIKNTGVLGGIMSTYFYPFVRDSKQQRIARDIQRQSNMYSQTLRKNLETPVSDERLNTRLRNISKKIEKLLEELNK